MKIKKWLISAVAMLALPALVGAANQEILFDFGWKFSKGECAGAEKPAFNDAKWDKVDLPHDWSIEGPFSRENPAQCRGAWLPTGKCAYRKSFTVAKADLGKRYEILFEGAYRNSEVWINGEYLGKRPMGYIPFHYDMTPHIKAGSNVITVKLDNSSQPGSRWYSGTGIYRHVYLKISDNLYIPTWGNYITANKVKGTTGVIATQTTVANKNTKGKEKFVVRHTVLDKEGKEVASVVSEESTVEAGKELVIKSQVEVANAQLWSGLKSPYLYTLRSEVMQGKKVAFTEENKVGIRTMEYDANEGFKLNGEVVKLQGMCVHHDGGPLGAAVYRRTIERQLEILQSMGANAVRCAHNPYSAEFYEVCDEKGFLVMAEVFDEWITRKSPSIMRDGVKLKLEVDYYSDQFKEWSDRDLTDALLHSRNFASIFMWSIGNEIHEMKNENGYPIGKRLAAIVHEHDYRPVTNGANGYGWNDWPEEDAVSTSDVRGYNYIKAEGFDIERKNAPQARAIVTECSAVQSYFPRGKYMLFPEQQKEFYDMLGYKGVYTFSELETNKFFRKEGIEALRTVKERPHIQGMFVWTGFDYLGEVTPFDWPARSSSFSPIDLCGFPKDGYYIYQSQWSEEPMVYVYPHWNWEGHEGDIIPLKVFTNCDKVELIVNGKSYGIQNNDVKGVDYKEWYVPYVPGEVRVVGYKGRTKKPTVEYTVRTADKASKVALMADRTAMKANSQDLIYVECNITDDKGTLSPDADNFVEFSVNGPAEIIGVGNGYNLSHEPFKAKSRKAFSGKCLVILKSTNTAGKITLTAKSAGLKSASVALESVK